MAGRTVTLQVEVELPEEGGAEAIIAQMLPWERNCIGRTTYRFVRRIRQDPALWALVKQKEAQLRAEGYFDRLEQAREGG